jgi:hypothetical protein
MTSSVGLFSPRKNSLISPRVALFSRESYEREVVGLFAVKVPALHDSRVDDRQVHLPELLKEFVVVAQDLHQQPALVGNHLESLGLDAFDHRALFDLR